MVLCPWRLRAGKRRAAVNAPSMRRATVNAPRFSARVAAPRLLSGWWRRFSTALHRKLKVLKKDLKKRREWWNWHLGNLTAADHRTLWLLALAHMALLAYSSALTFRSQSSRWSGLWYRTLTAQVIAFSEGLLVHRAVDAENHGDLVAAGVFTTIIGTLPLLEHARLAPPVEPPMWAALACLLVSVAFLTLVALLFSGFGWRRFMLFGSDPARRVLFDRLLNFHTLLTLDLIGAVLLALVVLDQAVAAAGTADGALVLWGGAAALLGHALYDGLLLCAARAEARRLVLLSLPVGLASQVREKLPQGLFTELP